MIITLTITVGFFDVNATNYIFAEPTAAVVVAAAIILMLLPRLLLAFGSAVHCTSAAVPLLLDWWIGGSTGAKDSNDELIK